MGGGCGEQVNAGARKYIVLRLCGINTKNISINFTTTSLWSLKVAEALPVSRLEVLEVRQPVYHSDL